MDIANVQKFLDMMVAKGKISKADADKKLAKHQAKSAAKANYKAQKDKLTKPELQALLDVFCSD